MVMITGILSSKKITLRSMLRKLLISQTPFKHYDDKNYLGLALLQHLDYRPANFVVKTLLSVEVWV